MTDDSLDPELIDLANTLLDAAMQKITGGANFPGL